MKQIIRRKKICIVEWVEENLNVNLQSTASKDKHTITQKKADVSPEELRKFY